MALMASSLLNGERAVVLLVLTRILYSAPLSLLLLEAISLLFLVFASFFVEISVENSTSKPKFSSRPGASSGILLGAVMPSAVLFSKLIQLSRGLPLQEVALADSLMKKYKRAKSNLDSLENLGASLINGVDATKMKFHTDLISK